MYVSCKNISSRSSISENGWMALFGIQAWSKIRFATPAACQRCQGASQPTKALLKSKLCNLGPPTLPYWDPVATNPSPKRNIGFSGLTSNHDQAITSTNRSGWLMVLDKYLKFTMQKWATSPASGSILGPTKTKVKDYCGSLQPDSTSSPSTLARQQYWIKHELWLRQDMLASITPKLI